MAQVPSTRWTVLDVLSSARELAKTVDQRKVLQEQGKYFYKAALSEIVTLLNSSVDPSYHTSQVLTIAADQETLKDVGDGAVVSVVSATAITRATGLFAVGEILTIAKLVTTGPTWTIGIYIVTTGGASAVISKISGDTVTYATPWTSSRLVVSGIKSLSTSSADLSSYLFDRITSIEDANVGQCKYVDPETFASLGRSDFQHKSYDDDIVWTLEGNLVRFRNGSKVTAGAKTMWYQRQPNYPTNWDDTEYVDIADKWVPLLIKRIYTFLILQTENDVPHNLAQEMQLDYQQISGFTTAEIANRSKSDKQAKFVPNS